MADFQTTRTIKSRKDRTCPECRALITLGQEYSKEAGRYDGDFYTSIMCMPCRAFADRYISSMQLKSCLNWDECTYNFGDIICEAAEFVGYKISPRQPFVEVRDAVMALFDANDEAERAHQARERENARRAKASAEKYRQHLSASLFMVRGMSARSALPTSLSAE